MRGENQLTFGVLRTQRNAWVWWGRNRTVRASLAGFWNKKKKDTYLTDLMDGGREGRGKGESADG